MAFSPFNTQIRKELPPMYSALQENTALDPFSELFLCLAYKKFKCQLRADAFPVFMHTSENVMHTSENVMHTSMM